MKAHITVGLGFGDEGKGSFVDYLSYQYDNSIVVRSSGGQQSGHAVMRDGIKHVFSSFGAGTLQNISSYFGEKTTIFLNNLKVEKIILNGKGYEPILYVHPLAMLTTPYDVAYNRITVVDGTCGLGIGLTMHRNLNTGYKLYAIDLKNPTILKQKLRNIKKYYQDLVENSVDLDRYIIEYNKYEKDFLKLVDEKLFEIEPYYILNNYDNVIFEGSQGIMLDMDHGIFPNVTYANTTSKNAIEICEKIGISEDFIETYYITRCYQTRHGRGWMSDERDLELINNEEEINEFNEYQEVFRVGELDYDLLNHSLEIDQLYNFGFNKNLVVTCLDQRPEFVFDYDKINGIENFKIYNSRSPESKNIFIDRF